MKTIMLKKLSNAIYEDQTMLEIQRQPRSLKLPDCWVGAGFIRNKAWDLLHDKDVPYVLNDVDVVFHDQHKVEDLKFEKRLEERSTLLNSKVQWEVVNQAKTHEWHDRHPYENTTEAISEWVETATCIGVRLNESGELEFTGPHGTDDLENLVLRPVPTLKNLEDFNRRVAMKEWLLRWPKLRVVLDTKGSFCST